MAIVEQDGISAPPSGIQSGLRPVRYTQREDDRHARDAILERTLRMVDPEVAASFTDEQRRAIRTILDLRQSTRSLIDLRHGFRLGERRFYVSLLFGCERRRLERGSPSALRAWLGEHGTTLIASAFALAVAFVIASILRG